ncbi:MAG TPA: FG-GAP repeat protein, partial [bacterium]
DMNGDGLAEVVVGGPDFYTGSGQGRAWVMFGNSVMSTALEPAGISLGYAGSGSVYFNGSKGVSVAGTALASKNKLGTALVAGDLNGDGLADLLAGAPVYAGGANLAHATLLFGGNTGTFGSVTDASLSGPSGTGGGRWMYSYSGSGALGKSVGQSMAIGNINGDGVDDAVVGIPDYAYSNGRVAVVLGVDEGTGSSFPSVLTNMAAGQGALVQGYTNLITTVGNPPAQPFTVYHDKATQLGKVVTTGDMNHGGRDDVIFSAKFTRDYTSYIVSGSVSGSGSYNGDRVFIVFGESLTFGSGAQSLSTLGSNVAKVELPANTTVTALHAGVDINGDGYKDLIIGVKAAGFQAEYYTQVVAYVVFGGPNLGGQTISAFDMASSQGFVVTAPATYQADSHALWAHVSVASGDVNGDGVPDVILGLEGYSYSGSTQFNDGKVYIIFGIDPGATFPEYVPQA